MRFNVPQFIEQETKIVGPLTFRQFTFIGTAGVIGLILYVSVPFPVFLVVSIVVGGMATALAFLKIGGVSLPSLLANFLKFGAEPKVYIWERKEQPGIKVYKSVPGKKKTGEEEEELPLKIAEKSRLKKLHTKIETETK
jgi:hypothetical protein